MVRSEWIADERVTAFLEKVKTTQDNWRAAHGVLINGGVYVFEKELLKAICIGKTVSLEKEVFPTLLVKKSLSAFETKRLFSGHWRARRSTESSK